MFFSHFCHNYHQNYQNYHHNYHWNHHYHHQKNFGHTRKTSFLTSKKEDQVARIGVMGGGLGDSGNAWKKTFFLLISSLTTKIDLDIYNYMWSRKMIKYSNIKKGSNKTHHRHHIHHNFNLDHHVTGQGRKVQKHRPPRSLVGHNQTLSSLKFFVKDALEKQYF